MQVRAAVVAALAALPLLMTVGAHAGPPPPIYIAAGYTGTGTPVPNIPLTVTATSFNSLVLKNTVTNATINCPAGVKFYGTAAPTGPNQSSVGFVKFTSSSWPQCLIGNPVAIGHGATTVAGGVYNTSWPLTAVAPTTPNSSSPYPQLNQVTATQLGYPTPFGANVRTAQGCRFSIVGSMNSFWTNTTGAGSLSISAPTTSPGSGVSLVVADQTQNPCNGGQFANGNSLVFTTLPRFTVNVVNSATGAAVDPMWVRA